MDPSEKLDPMSLLFYMSSFSVVLLVPSTTILEPQVGWDGGCARVRQYACTTHARGHARRQYSRASLHTGPPLTSSSRSLLLHENTRSLALI